MDLSKINLNELDTSDPGSWPLAVKIAAIVIVSVGVLVAGYFLDTEGQLLELAALEEKEVQLKDDFKVKQNKAVNLALYKEQMAEMERSFGAMLRQLPSKTEVADLLVDVSQTGLASGLEFQLFKPQAEAKAEFYAELPIQIRVVGRYHEFGKFVSDVAALPRIVTMQEISIKPGPTGSDELIMDAIAKTYRYLEDGEG